MGQKLDMVFYRTKVYLWIKSSFALGLYNFGTLVERFFLTENVLYGS